VGGWGDGGERGHGSCIVMFLAEDSRHAHLNM
jgi:hypothetical protein